MHGNHIRLYLEIAYSAVSYQDFFSLGFLCSGTQQEIDTNPISYISGDTL